MSQAAHQTGAYLGFCSMKPLGIFLPLDGMLAHSKVTASLRSPVPMYTPF